MYTTKWVPIIVCPIFEPDHILAVEFLFPPQTKIVLLQPIKYYLLFLSTIPYTVVLSLDFNSIHSTTVHKAFKYFDFDVMINILHNYFLIFIYLLIYGYKSRI